MPLNWDDDEDPEDLTVIEYKQRPARTPVPEKAIVPLSREVPSQKPTWEPAPKEPVLAQKYPEVSAAHPFTPAATKDRFVAFLIDSLLAYYVYWTVGFALGKFFNITTLALLHANRGRFALHIIGTLLFMLFYYVTMESIFGATLGKLFCRLRVVEENGQGASLGNIFIRNVLRIIDYPFLFLIAVISMESSPLNQRLGDRAAKTVVIKKTRRHLQQIDLSHTALASTLSRIFAEMVDLLLSLTLVYSFLLLIRPNRALLAYVMFMSIPVVFIFYYTLLEFFTGTTPGKALFKRQVILENGEPPDGTSALLRNLFRPLDYLLGYPLIVLSKRKQRLGDMAADTLVIAHGQGKRGTFGSLLALAFVLITAYFGFTNKNNFIRTDYGLGPVEGLKVFIPHLRPQPKRPPAASLPPKSTVPSAPSNGITKSGRFTLVEFYFATGPAPGQIRSDAIFRPGDLVFAFFKIQGFATNDKQEASLSEDLKIEDTEGKTVLVQKDIVKLTQSLKGQIPILFANQLKLPKNLSQGKYRAIFTVNDKIAKTPFTFEKSFELQ